MTDEKVVFGNCWEALAAAMGSQLDESIRKGWAGLGVDLNRLNAAYPYQTWLASLDLVLDRVPGSTLEERSYAIGRAMYERYGQTIVGKALLQVLAVLGPRRSLERMERNFRTSNNYSRTRLVQVEPNHYELEVSDVHYPHYYRGILEAGLERSAKNISVHLLSHQVDGPAVFSVRWS